MVRVSPRPYLTMWALGTFVDGASRNRTGDLVLAKHALSQLSYGPVHSECRALPGRSSAVEVEISRRALLEPELVVVGCVLEGLERFLQYVFLGLSPVLGLRII